MKKTMITLLGFLLLGACTDKYNEKVVFMMGYKPIYASQESLLKIETLPEQKLTKPGKIYVKGDYLFINEVGKGLFVYNNIDKKNPKQITFLSIPANNDISVKGDILYADNGKDLVVVDIKDPLDPRFVSRVKDVFKFSDTPPKNGRFECVDAAKGVVIGWEYVELKNPKCFN